MSIHERNSILVAENPCAGQLQEIEGKLKASSVKIRCISCYSDNFTRVERKGLETGTLCGIICGCFGSCYGIYLILCREGFTEYVHYCPACHSLIGTYKPAFSKKLKLLLVLAVAGVVALKIIAFIFFVVPKLT